ncbi:MAG: alpha/beta hydrolase [Betaproteobacteria bacterium]|nr:alpha/beta hydrolase [Betaproteobacteria bacterium]
MQTKIRIPGLAGTIETLVDTPDAEKFPEGARGIALVCHPHPLFGGTNTNKVVQTLARTFAGFGCHALRPNFRGVGGSDGAHDQGRGEIEDMLVVLDEARRVFGTGLPIVLAGFSFGAFVQTHVATRLAAAGTPAKRLVLVGAAAGHVETERHYPIAPVPADTILIHGARDETVPLANVLAWAEPQELPIIVVPGADHFFHRRLHLLRDIITNAWRD